jgi:hypothetical protein
MIRHPKQTIFLQGSNPTIERFFMTRLFVFAILFCFFSPLLAIQEDVNPILRRPDFLFTGNVENETHFLSVKAAKGGFSGYLMGDRNHSWQFKSAGDVGVVSFGQDKLWRISIMLEGLADSGADQKAVFRMRQAGYDFLTALEFRLRKKDVFYFGYHHRCRHGSDHVTDQDIPLPGSADSFDSRIVMRSGIETGYNAAFQVGNFKLINSSIINTYLWGQNIDITFQPRFALSSTLQAEYSYFSKITPFLSAGMGTSWVTASNDSSTKHYFLWSPVQESRWRFSPAAALGFLVPGSVGDFRVFVSYTSKLDTGFGKTTINAHFIMLSAEFWL